MKLQSLVSLGQPLGLSRYVSTLGATLEAGRQSASSEFGGSCCLRWHPYHVIPVPLSLLVEERWGEDPLVFISDTRQAVVGLLQ